METNKANSFFQNITQKIFRPSLKWQADLWQLKWIALAFIIIDFHWLNHHPFIKIDFITRPEFFYFIYALLFTVFFRNKLSFTTQIFNLISDFLIVTSFLCLSLSIFAYSSRIYVLYLIPIIYCSYWFHWAFALIFAILTSATYILLNYTILLVDMEKVFITSEIISTLSPMAAVFLFITLATLFFRKITLKYFVNVDRELKKHTAKLEQEKEYTRSLLKGTVDGYIAIDENGFVAEINKLARELFGYDEKDIYNQKVDEIYAPGEAAKIMNLLRQSPDGTIENFKTSVINKKDNEEIPILVSAAFLYDRKLNLQEELSKGKIFPSLGYFRDIRAEEIFDRISREITFMNDEKGLLTKIAGNIASILEGEVCSILIYNGATNRLEISTSSGIPPLLKLTQGLEHYEELEGMAGYVFSKGKTLNVKNIDIANETVDIANENSDQINVKWNYVKNFALYSKYGNFKHFLATPLRIQGEICGVIKVLNKYSNDTHLDKQGFQEKDQELLERISNQVSILFEKVRNKQRFDALSKVGMELNDRLDLPLDEFLGIVAKEVVEGMRFKACYIYLIEEGNKLKIKACHGLKGNYIENEKYNLRIGEGISGEVAQSGSHKLLSDKTKRKGIEVENILEKENLKAILSVPIKYQNKVIGVINCCTYREHNFTQEEIQIIQTFAIYTAVAIQNRNRVQELLDLNEIGSELVKPFLLEQLFDQILKKAKKISGADRLCIKAYDERTKKITTLGSLNPEWFQIEKDYAGELGEDFISIVIKEGKPKILSSHDIEWKRLGEIPDKELLDDVKSRMIVPIKMYGKVFGVLCLDSTRNNFFTNDGLLILNAFSNQAGSAIKTANFINKLQMLTETFPRISELQVNIDEVLQKIVDIAAEVLETDVLVLHRYDKKHKRIIWPPIYTGDIKYKEFVESEAVSSQTPISFIKRRKSHYADKSQEDSIMTSKGKQLPEGVLDRFVIREDIASSAGIILKVGHEIVGVMFINYRTPHEFHTDDQQIIEIFASYIAIAIQNVMHFSQTKVADVMRTIGTIASSFAHKMKNDIATITLYTGDLLDEIKPGHPQHFPLEQIKEKTSKITADIDHLQKASKLYINKREPINMKDFITKLKVEIAANPKMKSIDFDIDIPPDIPRIKIDPVQMKLVFINLAQNSIEAMPEGGKISISISKSKEDILIKWADSGPGISPENTHKIFDIFWTTKDKGYGLGLFHAKAIIEEHRGSISLDTSYRMGTQFLINLPMNQSPINNQGE